MMKFRYIVLSCFLSLVLHVAARDNRGQALASLLEQCLQEEEIHPDSLYPHMRRLEAMLREDKDSVRRSVTHIALGKLYAERAYRADSYERSTPAPADSLQEWTQMDYYRAAARHFTEALQRPDLLASTSAKTWMPLTQTNNAPFEEDMLMVAWHTMNIELAAHLHRELKLPKMSSLVKFYEERGNKTAALVLILDSIKGAVNPFTSSLAITRRKELLALEERYAPNPLCAEIYLLLARTNELTPAQRRSYLEEGLKRYPKYRGRAALKAALTRLENPSLQWETQKRMYPGHNYPWAWEVRNMQKVKWQLFKLPEAIKEGHFLDSIRQKGTLMQQEEHVFPIHDAIETFHDTLQWTAPKEEGYYAIVISPVVKASTTEKATPLVGQIMVTRGKTLYTTLPDGALRCEMVDALSGAPLDMPYIEEDLPTYRQRWVAQPDTTIHYDGRIFTDRAIYRPGQTAEIAGMAYTRHDWVYNVSAGQTCTVKIYDTQHKIIRTEEVVTDDYGMWHTHIDLPKGIVGQYMIVCGTARSYLRVEEYKRPTFNVTFDKVPEVHFPVENITVTGMAKRYNGAALSDARLVGTYSWRGSRWCWPYFPDESYPLDTIRTDHEGRFAVTIPVQQSDALRQGMWLTVNVTVTSAEGESHEASCHLSLCSQSVRLYADSPEIQSGRKPKPFSLHAYSSSEREMSIPATLSLLRGKEVVHSQSVETGKDVDLTWLAECAAGRYTWEAVTVWEGDTSRWSKEVLICNEKGNTIPVDTALWCYTSDEFLHVGDTAYVQIGTSLPEAYIYLTATANGTLVTDTTFCLTGATTWAIPYEQRFGQSVTISMATVYDEQSYFDRIVLKKQLPETRLHHRWKTFRDHLRPGETEEWTLQLTKADGTPVQASLIASLYDASLDAFGKHSIHWDAYRSHFVHNTCWSMPYTGSTNASLSLSRRIGKDFKWSYATLAEKYFSASFQEKYVSSRPVLYAAAPQAVTSVSQMKRHENQIEDADMVEAEDVRNEEGDIEKEETNVAMRENFQETAFFFPSLTTDENGCVALRFTLPESLTTWHLTGMAHTRDMLSAHLDELVVANKEVMAELHLPRFLRQGDKAVLSAVVINTDTTRHEGTATLTLMDAGTQRKLLTQRVTFSLQAGGQQTFTFPYQVADTQGAVICRWQAQSDEHSDGEQRLLPVLSDKEWVDYSTALWLNEKGTQNIKLDALKDIKGDSLRASVEYVTHPIWAAIQSLPTMVQPRYQNAFSISSALYAQGLAQWLREQVPELTTDTLLTDPALHQRTVAQWVARLGQLQQPNGGFCWFAGMPSSRYMTAEVAMLLARLTYQTNNKEVKPILQRAINYLQTNTPSALDHTALMELYICGLTKTKCNKAERQLLQQVEEQAQHTDRLHLTLSALVLQLNGKERAAERVMEQLKRYLVNSPDKGTYLDYAEGAQRSINQKLRIHTLTMEALSSTASDGLLLSGMRRWLLQQKRVQAWDTPLQNVDAVYALMQTDANDLLDRQRDALTLRCGNRMMRLQSADSQLGHQCGQWDVPSAPSLLSVNKRSEGESWAAVHVSALQKPQEVQESSTGLRLEVRYAQGVIQYVITADRDYDYVHLKAPRPACCEPVHALSSCMWQEGLCYYREVRDERTDFFFLRMPRGTYVIEEPVYVERDGEYSWGSASIQCLYAPEFQAHTKALRMCLPQK